MDRLLLTNCKKYATHHLISLILVIGGTVLIALFVSLFLNKSPAKDFHVYFIIIAVICGGVSLLLSKWKNHQLEISLDHNEDQHLKLMKQNVEILHMKAPFTHEAVYHCVNTGGGSRANMNELFLIFKEENEIKLTLRHSMGVLYDVPQNFTRRELGTILPNNEFSCNQIEKIENLVSYKKLKL